MRVTFACVVAVFAISHSWAGSENPRPAPQLERLMKAFSGRWSIAITVEPNEHMPKGGKGQGEEIWRSGPGGLSLIEDYHSTGDEGEISGLGVAWWDKEAGRFQVTWCDNTNSSGCSVMREGAQWEGNSVVAENEWEDAGKHFVFKEVFSEITENSFRQTLYQGESESTLKALATITATRKTATEDAREASPAPVAHATKLKMPGPDIQNYMLGTWSMTIKYPPGSHRPNGATGEATEVWRAGPGGYSLIEEYYQNDANEHTEEFSPAWWDAAAGGQRFVFCANTVPEGCYISKNASKWEGERLVYAEEREERGKKIGTEEIFEDIAPNSFTQIQRQGVPGKDPESVIMRATRKESAASGTQSPSAGSLSQLTHFSLDNLDPKADPCVDFYQYACGGWLASHPIPADQVWWETSSALQDRNEALLRGIGEESMVDSLKRDATHQKIGDYYAACMDEGSADAAGTKPIEAELERISAINNRADLAAELGRLHRMLYLLVQGSIFPSVADAGSREPLFGFFSYQDLQDAAKVVAFVDQGGIGLPDRDYYLRGDKESVEVRQRYATHISNMLALLNQDSDPEGTARRIVDIETALARSWMDVAARHDRANLNNTYSLDKLQRLMPNFDWTKFLAAVGAPPSEHYLVATPEFLRTVNSLLGSASLDDWKAYLRWNLLRASASLLSRSFVKENFDFYGKILTGAKENASRWKRCVWATDRDLQDALGRVFVEQSFHEDDKQRVLQIVKEVEAAFDGVIHEADWLSPETRTLVLAKLHAVTNRVGYPEQWRDYSALNITRDSWAANVFRSSEYELARQLNHIGQPPDRNEWWMTVTTLDAYNNPRQNSLTFPAGWLGAPLFDRSADDSINFGSFGSLAGHEVTHGFDSMGRKYDSSGSLRNWWPAEDAQRFEQRSKCFVDQYSSYVAVDDVKLNGELTLAENIADGVGARLAYLALQSGAKNTLPSAKLTDGFTPDQRFFLSYALRWCGNITPEVLKIVASGDSHSTLKYRVNGVVSNMPEFQQAFHCKPGQPMVRANACRVW